MIKERVKEADNHLRKGCEKIPQRWRKRVVVAMIAILVVIYITIII